MIRLTPARMILAALAGLAAVQIVHYAFALPPQVASHFDGSSRTNGSMPREAFLAIYAGLVVLFSIEGFLGSALLKLFPVNLINLPWRKYWLAPERAEASLDRMGNLLAWGACGTIALVASAMELTFRANFPGGGFDMSQFAVLMTGFLVACAGWMVALLRAFPKPPAA